MESIYLTEEQQYIKELKLNSKKAFKMLYQLYCRRLYAFAYQYTKSKEDSEEIVQDTFVKLWTYRQAIRSEDSVSAFLFQIAKNLLINRFHKLVNSPIFEEFVVTSSELACQSEETSHRLEYEEFRKTLTHFIHELPSTQQKIVDCRLFKELTPPETAKLLQLSEQTVRNQFSLALKKLREKLATYNKLWIILLHLLCVIKQ